jgi:hypothetical protein
LEVAGRAVGDRVQVKLAGEEVACRVGQWPWLVGAVEVELEGVDAFKAQLVDPIEVSRGGRASRVSRSSSCGLAGLNWIESPSGSKPVGLPAWVWPTR